MEPSPAGQRLGHDLSNQLSIILGFSELLLARMPDTDSRKEDLREIQKAAKAAMQLVTESLSRRL